MTVSHLSPAFEIYTFNIIFNILVKKRENHLILYDTLRYFTIRYDT